jgi:hypothetical protein
VVVARFAVQDQAEISTEGTTLRVSELSLRLESSDVALEVAKLLRAPALTGPDSDPLPQAEERLRDFLVAREEALGFLQSVRKDPRAALLAAQSMWPQGDTGDPYDAISSAFASRVTRSQQAARAFLDAVQMRIGYTTMQRLYALAYTVGASQDALFSGSDATLELAALQELGIPTTMEDLRLAKSSEKLMERAHPVLEALAQASAEPSQPLS